MIIGKNRLEVIKNIEEAVKLGELNKKVEIDDPKLSSEEKNKIITKYITNKNKVSFKLKTKVAKSTISILTNFLHKDTQIVGIENIENIKGSAIITCNHFNQLDNLIIQKLAKNICQKRLYILSQETNLAMDGIVGFFMNYSDIIPITDQAHYMNREFPKIIKEILQGNNLILIYPEQEMWFNYKKPRPPKKGAYYYAAKNKVPIISCFVEMIESEEKENEEFKKIKYKLHILKPIYPDPNISAKENSSILSEIDYKQKKEAYEKIYKQKLNYNFTLKDISGLIQNNLDEIETLEATNKRSEIID